MKTGYLFAMIWKLYRCQGFRDLWGKMGGKMDEQALPKENAEKFDTPENEIFQVLMQSLLFFCNIGFPLGSEQNRTCDTRLIK